MEIKSKVIHEKTSGSSRLLTLENGMELEVHRYACVSEGDTLILNKKNENSIYVVCENGFAQIYPFYCEKEFLRIGNKKYLVNVKEITTKEELDGYRYLSRFHYRGKKFYGRRAPLIITSQNSFFPKVLGYIDIASSFIMNKSRYELFNAPFKDDTGEISWEKWDMHTRKKYTNVIVRIARCVVHPEFRGLGLGQLLVSHSFTFSKNHWQIARLRPLFLEITADMLKFIPFVQKAGMIYIGKTQGNLRRIKRDMEYILTNFRRVEKGEILRKDSGAIVELQLKYAEKAKKILKKNNMNLEDFISLIPLEEKLSLENYAFFHGLLRFPKPTYMKGLTPEAQKYIERRVKHLKINNDEINFTFGITPLKRPIELKNVTLEFISSVTSSPKTIAIQEAFGILPEQLNTLVFTKLNIKIKPKQIVLICGASGSGKTTFLKLLTQELKNNNNVLLTGKIVIPPDVKIGKFKTLSSNRPLIELFGDRNISKAIYILNSAGLSEAYIYLRKFNELSKGQQYRAMMAKVIDSKANLWIADEFCSTLDPITANIVSANIRKHARKVGATVVVAAPHYESFIHSLRPDLIIKLMGNESRTYKRDEFFSLIESE